MNYPNVETLRSEHYKYLQSIMPSLVERLTWTNDQISGFRTKALRELLNHAKLKSPWHASRLAHIDAATASLKDLQKIPVMGKPDLMENWDRVVTVPGATLKDAQAAFKQMTDQFYYQNNTVLVASSGTGGQPGIFLYDWAAMATNLGSMTRPLVLVAKQRFGGLEGLTVATVGAEMSAHSSYVMGRIFSNPEHPSHQLSAWRSIDELIAKLNVIKPHHVNCYSSCVPELVVAASSGELDIDPYMFFFTAENLTETNRKLVTETWPNARIFTCWATSEGAGTFPCPLGDGFHISDDLFIIEPVDSNGDPVARGEASSGIYITNLFNKAMPIIRYYIDDIFELSDKRCMCGSAYTKIQKVHGRSYDWFEYDTVCVFPPKLELAVLEQPTIFEYQIVQTRTGANVFFRRKGEVDKERLAAKIREGLESYGILHPDVNVEEVKGFERAASGKLNRFIPLKC